METLKAPFYYVFYTGNASTPWSVGIAKRTTVLGTGDIIKETKIEEETGKAIRAKYNRLCKEYETECKSLNDTLS